MATCHQTHTEWMAPHVVDRKRVSSIDDHPLKKHMKLCPTSSELHKDITCIMHVTRKRSHELTKLLCPSPQRDCRLICHQLDPSIFDAEVSEDEEDVNQVPRLLPEVRAKLQCLLKPQCLDAGYDEGTEIRNSSIDDDSEELPDLDDDNDNDDDNNDGYSSDNDHDDDHACSTAVPHPEENRIEAILKATNSKVKTSKIIPVLDKLKLLPVVQLTRLEELHPRVTKKLKLKTNGVLNGDQQVENKFVWNQEHHSRLRSILFSVGRHLSASKTSCTESAKPVNGSCRKVGIVKPLKIQMNVNDDVSDDQSPFMKSWNTDSESSDSDSDTAAARWRMIKPRTLRQQQEEPTNTPVPVVVDHPSHATCTLGRSVGLGCKLNHCIAEMLKSCDTEDSDFQLRFLRLCNSCLVEGLTWPVEILQQLLQLVQDASCASVQWGAYDVLSTLLTYQHSIQLPFTWQHLSDTSECILHLIQDRTTHLLLGPVLALQYMVSVLEQDAKLSPSGHQSTAARWFAVDQRYQCASQIASWLLDLVRVEPSCASSVSVTPQVACSSGSTPPAQAPRLLPLFQRLLDLSVAVSTTSDVHLDRLVTELSQGYVRLKTYTQRHRLVSSIKPSVIVFKLCSRLLDNYGCSKMVSLPDGRTVADLLDMYSTCMPLDLHITDEDAGEEHETENKDHNDQVRMRYSPTAIEELAFLTWSLISARVRMNKGKEVPVMTDVKLSVEKLEAWYRSLTAQLSPKTQLYLKMIECLNPS